MRILIPIIACLVLVGCEEKQEVNTALERHLMIEKVLSVETRPDHLFTQCDGSQLRLPEGALYSSVVREHTDGWEIQLRNGRYFYVQENPLESLGIPLHPCQPETVTLLVKIDSTTYYDGGTEHHWSYVSPDTVMPPGQWVNPKQLLSWPDEYWPDSAFILSKSGEK